MCCSAVFNKIIWRVYLTMKRKGIMALITVLVLSALPMTVFARSRRQIREENDQGRIKNEDQFYATAGIAFSQAVTFELPDDASGIEVLTTGPLSASELSIDSSGLITGVPSAPAVIEARIRYRFIPDIATSSDANLTTEKRIRISVSDNVPAGKYIIRYVNLQNETIQIDSGNMPASETWYDLQLTSAQAAGYVVSPNQDYSSNNFKYGEVSKVLIGGSYNSYIIKCVRVSSNTGRSSGGGSSGSSGGGATSYNPPVRQGWIYDGSGWYYYSGTSRSTLKKGWHLDPQDGFWYYLATDTGKMFEGWHDISGKWYYFNPYTPFPTWELGSDNEWHYKHIQGSRPLGSMFKAEKTPDGYSVDENGAYIPN